MKKIASVFIFLFLSMGCAPSISVEKIFFDDNERASFISEDISIIFAGEKTSVSLPIRWNAGGDLARNRTVDILFFVGRENISVRTKTDRDGIAKVEIPFDLDEFVDESGFAQVNVSAVSDTRKRGCMQILSIKKNHPLARRDGYSDVYSFQINSKGLKWEEKGDDDLMARASY